MNCKKLGIGLMDILLMIAIALPFIFSYLAALKNIVLGILLITIGVIMIPYRDMVMSAMYKNLRE